MCMRETPSVTFVKIGDRVGSFNSSGYMTTKINSKQHLVHRLIYLHQNGEMPEIVDHVDGNPRNNMIENLRAANRSENNCNSSVYKNNSTGVKGVSYSKRTDSYIARVQRNGKRVTIGSFKLLEDAKQAVNAARLKIHGKFCKNQED